MVSKLRGTLACFAVIGVFAGFFVWGEIARAREWWWIGGDGEGLVFLDLRNPDDSEGHLLLTRAAGADEFAIMWSCQRRSVRWGEMWRLDADMQQIERSPPPPDLAEWHTASSSQERRLLEVACALPEDRFALRSVRATRQPIQATRDLVFLVSSGAKPSRKLLFEKIGAVVPVTGAP